MYRKVAWEVPNPAYLFSRYRVGRKQQKQRHKILDTGHIRDAAHRVMLMFDLAEMMTNLAKPRAAEFIHKRKMGRATANFEAADRHLTCDINDSTTPQA